VIEVKKLDDTIIVIVILGILILSSRIIPMWMALSLYILVSAIYFHRRRSAQLQKMKTIQQRLSNLRGQGLFIGEQIKKSGGDIFYKMILNLLTDLERSLYKLVEKNIQLLSLKEIGRNIVSSLDEQKLVESVLEYLTHGIGYREAAFVFLRKRKGIFQAIITIERADSILKKVISFGFDELEGSIYESFRTGQPFLIKNTDIHPLMKVKGEPIFPQSTMQSYLCVPLLKSAEEKKCYELGECAVLDKAKMEGNIFIESPYLTSPDCLACPNNPLLGAIIVTDGYKAKPLTNIDQVTIETVASLVSSNIENWNLYMDLKREEKFRENVIEGMINGVFVTDLAGSITLANRSARKMSMLKEEELRELNIKEIILTGGGGDEHISPIDTSLESGLTLTFVEGFLKRKDDSLIPIRMNISPMFSEKNERQGIIIEFVDISELKKMEEEIRQLDRLAVLGRFTSAVAHEIRNPLTGIAAGIQYLNRSNELSDEQKENISFILNEVARLNRIITDLFKIVKPKSLLYQKVRIKDLVNRSYRAVEELFREKNIDFSFDAGNEGIELEVDPDQIEQVLINLLKNAAEAVDNGGSVEVRISECEEMPTQIVNRSKDEILCISVTDNGDGISEEDKSRIFEPFFSRKKGGTGLGLFISHSIIQHHGGHISVDSRPGTGTTFSIILPINRQIKGGRLEASNSSG